MNRHLYLSTCCLQAGEGARASRRRLRKYKQILCIHHIVDVKMGTFLLLDVDVGKVGTISGALIVQIQSSKVPWRK